MALTKDDESGLESLKSSSSVSVDEGQSESLKLSSLFSVEEGDEELESESAQMPFFSKKVNIADKSESAEDEDDDEVAQPIKTASSKRAAAFESETENGGDTISKKAKNNGIEEAKKNTFGRVFSEDDVVVILKGLVEYKVKAGVPGDPNIKDFRDFIVKSLSFEATQVQLYEKIRRLKKRYENKSKKGKTTFKVAYDQEVFDLSKKIWGTDEADKAETKINPSSSGGGEKKEFDNVNGKIGKIEDDSAKSPVWGNYFNMSGEELVMKHGLDIIQGPKKLELEEKWKQYEIEAVKLHGMRMKLLAEQTSLVLEAMKSRE